MRRSYNPPAITARLESAGGGTPHAALRSGRGVRIWSRRHRSAGAGANLSIEASQNHRALCARRFDRRGGAALFRTVATELRAGRVRGEQTRARRGSSRSRRWPGARPDGHTLMIGNISTNALTPVVLAKKMKIDYEQDAQIVTPLADVPVFFLATTTNFSPTTFADFLAYAREHPGKVRYGSAGVGSYQQINTEILAKRAGLDLVHIPFKGGGAEILRDLANGDIHVSWFNTTTRGVTPADACRQLSCTERVFPCPAAVFSRH